MDWQPLIWPTIVVGIALWIAIAISMSKRKASRLRREARSLLPEVHDHFKSGSTYRVVLTSGLVLDAVKFVGISAAREGAPELLPFPLQNWVILEKPDSKRVFVKSNAIRLYEEL
jgi:hypothetical protein